MGIFVEVLFRMTQRLWSDKLWKIWIVNCRSVFICSNELYSCQTINFWVQESCHGKLIQNQSISIIKAQARYQKMMGVTVFFCICRNPHTVHWQLLLHCTGGWNCNACLSNSLCHSRHHYRFLEKTCQRSVHQHHHRQHSIFRRDCQQCQLDHNQRCFEWSDQLPVLGIKLRRNWQQWRHHTHRIRKYALCWFSYPLLWIQQVELGYKESFRELLLQS